MGSVQAIWGASSWLIAVPVLTVVSYVVGRLLASLTIGVVRRVAARQAWSARLVPPLRAPITMGFALGLFWLGLPHLPVSTRVHDIVERLLRALGYLAFFWALVRTVSVVGDEVAEAKWARAHPNVRSITDVGVTLGRVVVGALALMVALSQLGYNVTTVVAGLGIGGVALALAAQKTVENLFGSVSILADQPFKVGDTVRVDGIEGAVENIGLRSTRIRTVERTLVIIPNGKLADMRIESLGPRDRIRFSAKLPLSRDTTVAQIQTIIASLKERLVAHASVYTNDTTVRLGALGESSFDIDVAAPIETTNTGEFARVREDLLLECIRAVDEAGASLAIPARRIVDGAQPGLPR